MPERVALQTIHLGRHDGKSDVRKEIPAGTRFDFTSAEIKELEQLDPPVLAMPADAERQDRPQSDEEAAAVEHARRVASREDTGTSTDAQGPGQDEPTTEGRSTTSPTRRDNENTTRGKPARARDEL